MSEATVMVTDLGAQGDGVAEINGETVYIAYTLPGEMVVAKRKGASCLLYTSPSPRDA